MLWSLRWKVMPLGVNAISLAEKLRTPEDQILELQRHHVLPTSYTCPSCKVTTQKLEVEAKSNYHYFRCAGCKSRTSLRYLFVILTWHVLICVQLQTSMVCLFKDGHASLWEEDRDAVFSVDCLLLCGLLSHPRTAHPRDWFVLLQWQVQVEHGEQDQHPDSGFIPWDF